MINYVELAGKYKPESIKVLLIGEAPPPNETSYFYKVPDKYPSRNTTIENDTNSNPPPMEIFLVIP